MKIRRETPTSTGVTKRHFLTGAAGAAIGASLGPWRLSSASQHEFDLIVIGGGNAGLPAAIFAAQRGARVLILDSAPTLGGTLFFSGGRMSAAGTKLQKQMGIQDSPDLHFEDVMRLSNETANPELLRLAVDHAAPAFDWLMANGLELADGVPVRRGMTHETQNRARYVWAREGGMGILLISALADY